MVCFLKDLKKAKKKKSTQGSFLVESREKVKAGKNLTAEHDFGAEQLK